MPLMLLKLRLLAQSIIDRLQHHSLRQHGISGFVGDAKATVA
jgi:hypothetical protein